MLDPEKKKKAIQAVIQEMMDSVMNKVLKWHATIRFRGKNCHLGYYDNEGIAAQRYKIAHDWQVINL